MPIQGSTTSTFVFGARTTPQSDTLVLLPFDGNYGDTTTQDLVLPRKYVTFYGSASLDSNSRFGSTSLNLNGGQDRVEVLLTERTFTAFTIEAWVSYTNFTSYAPIASLGIDEDNCLEYATDGQRIRTRIRQGGVDVFNIVTAITAIQRNVWRHYVLVCDGTNMRFMIDGTTYSYYSNTTFPFPASKFTVGNFLDGVNNIGAIDGYIDDVRLSKVVRYNDPYSVPSLPLVVLDAKTPNIRSFKGSFNSRQTSTISILGFNFTSYWSTVRFYNNSTNTLVSTSSTVTLVNSQEITATTETTAFPFPDIAYVDIEIEHSLTYEIIRFNQAFISHNYPIWQTPEGSIANLTMPNRNINVALSTTLALGSDPIRYSLVSGELPPGVALNSTTGSVFGLVPVVTEIKAYVFVVRATANNDINRTADRTFSITINP